MEKRDIKFFLCHTAKQTNSFINSYFSETYSCIFVKDKKPESIGVLWSAVVLWKIEYHPCQESWRLKKEILWTLFLYLNFIPRNPTIRLSKPLYIPPLILNLYKMFIYSEIEFSIFWSLRILFRMKSLRNIHELYYF